jgi:hypothetical protein
MTQTLGLIADIIGILGAVFALFSWMQARQLKKIQEQEKIRLNQKVGVILQHGQEKLELPVAIRRAELSRGELLGRLGMIPLEKRGGRFSLGYLNTAEFFQQMGQILEGQGEMTLIIPCSKEEFEQFDLDN